MTVKVVGRISECVQVKLNELYHGYYSSESKAPSIAACSSSASCVLAALTWMGNMSESTEKTILVIDWSAGTKCVRKKHIGSVRKFTNFPRQIVRRYQESQFIGVCRKTLVSEFKINQRPCRVWIIETLTQRGPCSSSWRRPSPCPCGGFDPTTIEP